MSYQQTTVVDGAYLPRPATAFTQSATRTQQDAQTLPGYHPATARLGAQADLNAMINAFGNTHLGLAGPNMAASTTVPPATWPLTGGQFYYTADGQVLYAPHPSTFAPLPVPTTQETNFGAYTAGAVPYVPQTYPGYAGGYPTVPYTPARAGVWPNNRSESIHKDVPPLENRRGSYSTNESAPGTPFYGGIMSAQEHGSTRILTVDRSPMYSTPSPQQYLQAQAAQAMVKSIPIRPLSISEAELNRLLEQDPAIPRAVPAVFTPRENMRTLDQSLSNPIPGNRNVYIRGLHPNTDDETLELYAARFGKIETSKAIIDTATGACKGFGFAKYVELKDSEKAIRGFYRLGYEVGFARESFNSRLKAQGDESSTNLYVSNLPKTMTESELGAIFMDYVVSSSRILRDALGHSRGVGFARFESRDVCEEIIKKFHGQPIGEEGLLLQVRYADTPAQKDLKRLTTERRQFRTTEYNVGADIISRSPSLGSPAMPRVSQVIQHVPNPIITSGVWTQTAQEPISAINASVAFKDVDKSMLRGLQKNSTFQDTQARATTPTPSEEDSYDEGTTIQGHSPAPRHGVSLNFFTDKKS